MKEPTDIRKTWQPYLQSGEIIEKEFLAIVRKFYPQAGKYSAITNMRIF